MTLTTTASANREIAQQNFSVDIMVDGFFGMLDYHVDSPELSAEARKYAEMVVLNELIFGSPMIRNSNSDACDN